MSHYERYDQRAGDYDTTRSAIGSEIWLGNLISHFGSLADIRVLDAGCGTGNYTFALAQHVRHVTAIDANQQMLLEARRKAAQKELVQKVTIEIGSLPELPFGDNSFDAVMFNQVLHHLEPLGPTEFKNHRAALLEASRVLRRGGIVLISGCSRRQMSGGFWYHALIPDARSRALARTIGSQELRHALREAGFERISRTVPLDALIQGDASLDANGPLDPGWRAGDSVWALATDVELETALARCRELQRTGALEGFMHKHDRRRNAVGQTTFWTAVQSS